MSGIGIGGTNTGTGAYLEETSGGRVTVVGADPEASVYSGGNGSPHSVERSGHLRHPQTVDDVRPDSCRTATRTGNPAGAHMAWP
ncbi:hypothetical protein ACIHCV_22695 [Streptomyces sp. NPDC051956]|uniref:hypothetical protein n=1 Tax=Streptomyces sp. NPDC051956 TaxID=3365677 RepID=UPI0037D3151E